MAGHGAALECKADGALCPLLSGRSPKPDSAPNAQAAHQKSDSNSVELAYRTQRRDQSG